MTKSNWRDELYLGERVGGAGTLVRQGIKEVVEQHKVE